MHLITQKQKLLYIVTKREDEIKIAQSYTKKNP